MYECSLKVANIYLSVTCFGPYKGNDEPKVDSANGLVSSLR